MSSSGSPEERESRIFIQALRDYSNGCEAPELTPSCPFYELSESGSAGCAEQCMDILATRADDTEGASTVALGSDIHIVRRVQKRSRRNPNEKAPIFDAAEIQIRDRDRPTREKRTVSLVRDLDDALFDIFAADRDERRYIIEASWDELERRGIDVARMIRATAVFSVALFTVFQTLDSVYDVAAEPSPNITRWRSLLMEAHARDTIRDGVGYDEYVMKYGAGIKPVVNWFARASRSGLIDASPPTIDDLLGQPHDSPDDESGVGRWLHDRFAQTYTSDWAPKSLALEWAYMHGDRPGCGAPDTMRERWVDPVELSAMLARFATSTLMETDGAGNSRSSLDTGNFAVVAAIYLKEAKYEAAASIFRAILHLRPEDAVAHNHLGFCLIPIDLNDALNHLEQSAALAEAPDMVNVANQVLVLHLMGRDNLAHKLGADALLTIEAPTLDAWLWDYSGGAGGIVLGRLKNVRDYLSELVRKTGPA